MADPRVDKMARVLVQYSLKLKPGDLFRIRGEWAGLPLALAVYREAILAGANVLMRMAPEETQELFYKHASDAQLGFVSDIEMREIEAIDAELYISADANTRLLAGIDPERIAQRSAARHDLIRLYDERAAAGDLRWCLTRFPTTAYAQDAGMSLADYEDFVYSACLLDKDDPVAAWKAEKAEQERIIVYLSQHDTIRITAPGTDITYRIGGRKWLAAAGELNFPDGEIYTAPHEASANGVVTFTYPVVEDGNEVEGVRLTFKDGKVVESYAEKGLPFLNSMLDTDAGARYLGEVAFGMNYGVTRFSKDTLFDEKIGGTMHMAVGATILEAGGTNESSIHWDMVCDMREGEVYADGELCYKEGRFII